MAGSTPTSALLSHLAARIHAMPAWQPALWRMEPFCRSDVWCDRPLLGLCDREPPTTLPAIAAALSLLPPIA